jgi:hypothetical protein
LSWSQTGKRKIFGPNLVTEAEEKVKTIQNNLKEPKLDRKATLIYKEDHYSFKSETEAEEKVKTIQNNLKEPKLDRKATLIYEEDHYSFKSETSYIFEYLLLEVFKGSA